MSKSTAAYLAKNESEAGIKCITFEEIPVKSFDASPTDFCAFCLLKQALEKWHLRTLNEERFKRNGLKLAKVYFLVESSLQKKSLHSCKIRARAAVKNHSYKIEANPPQNTTFIDKILTIKIVPAQFGRPSVCILRCLLVLWISLKNSYLYHNI
ncbi:hypothetical protein TNCV_1411911 [Trichonephila clavipes]|nr:hypothetical protein TNCV_1411911 [Trichonephila clavipes]